MKSVYFIAGGGHTKVGTTLDVERRLRAMQTCSPVELRVIFTAPGGHALERALHRLMAEGERARGEWYLGEISAPAAEALVAEALALPRALTAAEAYERHGRPECACHGEPMRWARSARLRAGGEFRCRMRPA